jgi:DNA-cytosine methyltransferase
MNVLSLFDGMSCGRIALERAGLRVDNYFASEIDPHAIKVAKANWPEIQHIGSVTEVKAESLPQIDLLIGGSPCQGFSFAGKQLNFEDPRSKLFFEYVRLLKECKPKYFLLENVVMKKEYQDVISKELGVEPILINSALVSAQNRKRLYWTNIPNIVQPEDKGLLLKDILEKDFFADRDKSFCLDANYFKGGNPEQYFGKSRRQLVFSENLELKHFSTDSICHHVANATDISGNETNKRIYAESGKSPTLTTMGGGHREPKVLVEYTQRCQRQIKKNTKRLSEKALSFCTNANSTGSGVTLAKSEYMWRKLTPLECERLQTVPEGYTAHVSNTQRYKMLGNGWTVDVIAHILKNLQCNFAK